MLTKKEYIEQINRQTFDKNDRDFRKFKKFLKKGRCSLCRHKLNSFHPNVPCAHWLLRPEGIDKEQIFGVLDKFGWFRSESFLRWLANTVEHAKFINDLSEEKSTKHVFETTIKYKNLEWSFSCSPADLLGHKDSMNGEFPHYHIQMTINNRPFITFGERHCRFKPYDLWVLDVKAGKFPDIKHIEDHGMGMQGFFDAISSEELVENMIVTDDYENAPLNPQTIVIAEPGHSIKGEDIVALQERSKKTGESMAKLLRTLPNVKVQTIIQPGDGVPELSVRTKRNRGKNK